LRLGLDLTSVRIHSDARAAESAEDLHALAYSVGQHVVFGAGQYAEGSAAHNNTLAHELAHVLQQPTLATPPDTDTLPVGPAEGPAEREAGRLLAGHDATGMSAPRQKTGHAATALQRKVKLRGPNTWLFFSTWTDLTSAQRSTFLAREFSAPDRSLAAAIVDDMASAADEFQFEDIAELQVEVRKRLRTSQLMRETQRDLGPQGRAFGYPAHAPDGSWLPGLGPRVNSAASAYWGPVLNDNGSYYFQLSDLGRANAYQALVTLFAPQLKKDDRTLIHCDYLASVVHYRVFAETLGAVEFDSRVKNGALPMVLKWNGFADIETDILRSGSRESLQEVRPTSEQDLVIGDHVVFWNHRTYDLINAGTHEAWRLENAVVVVRTRAGEDVFLGHGSGEKSKQGMLDKLAAEYNKVVAMASAIIARTKSANPAIRTAATAELGRRFPHVMPVGSDFHVQGDAHGRTVDRKLTPITTGDPELVGLRDPRDLSLMNLVRRPK
jgi:Domain of unknown function (DUF4157)/Protein-glutamine gamma-glutamyltransferase